ncbi:MAG: flagellar biosynthetic protein FliR [Planctomycetota bacterium]
MDLIPIQLLGPQYAAVVFRFAGLMLFMPMFGSGRIPKRVKVMFAIVCATSLFAAGHAPAPLPDDPAAIAMGLGGEILFGFALGMVASLTFIGAQWAGNAVGQQMGIGLGAVFDPSSDVGGSPVSDVYFLLTLFIFLGIDGHVMLVRGALDSFAVLPPLSVGVDADLLTIVIGMFTAATSLMIRIGAPLFVAMLACDVCLGFIGKTVPQLNLLAAGLSLRSLVGMMLLVFTVGTTQGVIVEELTDALHKTYELYTTSRS